MPQYRHDPPMRELRRPGQVREHRLPRVQPGHGPGPEPASKSYRKPAQWFTVDRICPNCGERHRQASQVQIAYGPSEEKMVAEVYGEGLPPVVRELLRAEVWCEHCQGYWVQGDLGKVFVRAFGVRSR